MEEKPKQVEEPRESKNRPLENEWIGLGEGKGISISVWGTHIQFQRRERDPNSGEWKTMQELSVAPMVAERLFIRLPHYFQLMNTKKDKG